MRTRIRKSSPTKSPLTNKAKSPKRAPRPADKNGTQDGTPEPDRKGKRLFLCAAIAVILAAFLCSRFVVQLLLIQGDSMLPAYHNMQLVLLEKGTHSYEPGNVIAFRCDALQATLIKRIAAGPGDTVQILDGTLYVNGSVSTVYPEAGCFTEAGILSGPVTLKSDEYFVIGDNMGKSKDSRTVGPVKRASILGLVID